MLRNVQIQDIESKITLLSKESYGFDATISFSYSKKGKKFSDKLLIRLGKDTPTYEWNEGIFPHSIREYLELKSQQQVDDKLIRLEQSELNS